MELKDESRVHVGITESLTLLHLELSILNNSKFCILNNANVDLMH